MMTDDEYRCLYGANALLVALVQRGIQASIHGALSEPYLVRVAGLDTVEAVPTASDRYAIWTTNESPHDAAPLRIDLSLGETVQFLSQFEGRA